MKSEDNSEDKSVEEMVKQSVKSAKNCKTDKSSDLSKSADILPLNSAVIQRIRLNISTGLPISTDTDETIVCIEAKRSDDRNVATVRQSIGTVLQKSMKQKLADVLQTDSEGVHYNPQEGQAVDTASLLDHWSALDSQYKTISESLKNSNAKVICIDTDLWHNFDQKMRQLKHILDPLCTQTKRSGKRSPQQNSKHKKLKRIS